MAVIKLPARQLLLIDAAGAAATSLLTALVLAPGRLPTGLPSFPLYLLAAVAACFCLFGVVALGLAGDPASALRILAGANLSYGAATAVLCVIHGSTLTGWGIAYFAGEIAILAALAAAEISAAKR